MSRTRKTVLWVIVGLAVAFIVFALLRSAPRAETAEAPELSGAPTRVYGRIEPAGGEVFVAPPLSREVVEIVVTEGDSVEQGQVLCVLENSIERAQAEAARARVESARRAWELSRDSYVRNRSLEAGEMISDQELKRLRLRAELDSVNLVAVKREAELARLQLERLALRAPVTGLVYKFDVRLGQTLVDGDNKSIILGERGLWARLYVESFWLDRVAVGDRFRVHDAETHEKIGVGRVLRKAPYVGTREIRTEDTRARVDAEFQEVIVELTTTDRPVPIGLYVLAELER